MQCVSPRESSQSVLTLEPAFILFEVFSRDESSVKTTLENSTLGAETPSEFRSYQVIRPYLWVIEELLQGAPCMEPGCSSHLRTELWVCEMEVWTTEGQGSQGRSPCKN